MEDLEGFGWLLEDFGTVWMAFGWVCVGLGGAGCVRLGMAEFALVFRKSGNGGFCPWGILQEILGQLRKHVIVTVNLDWHVNQLANLCKPNLGLKVW